MAIQEMPHLPAEAEPVSQHLAQLALLHGFLTAPQDFSSNSLTLRLWLCHEGLVSPGAEQPCTSLLGLLSLHLKVPQPQNHTILESYMT